MIRYGSSNATSEEFIRKVVSSDAGGIGTNFDKNLKSYKLAGATFSQSRAHRHRCRSDTLCMDQGLVTVNWPGAQAAFINTSAVSTVGGERRFLLGQSPMSKTAGDFWHMVCQEGTLFIVMLGAFIDEETSFDYWPLEVGGTVTFSGVTIVNAGETFLNKNEDIVVHQLKVTWQVNGAEKQASVEHYQVTSWPEDSVPSIDMDIFAVIKNVLKSTAPIAVHCSNGVGSSGTFVLMASLMERIEKNQGAIDVEAQFMAIRNQRAFAVSNKKQYLYVHAMLLRYYTKPYLLPSQANRINKFVRDFAQISGTSARRGIVKPFYRTKPVLRAFVVLMIVVELALTAVLGFLFFTAGKRRTNT